MSDPVTAIAKAAESAADLGAAVAVALTQPEDVKRDKWRQHLVRVLASASGALTQPHLTARRRATLVVIRDQTEAALKDWVEDH